MGGLHGPLRPLWRGPDGRRRAQSREFPTVPLGEHRGQHQFRWHAWWGWRRYLGDDLAGDPVGHLITDPCIQLRCAREELAGQLGLIGTESRTTGATMPTTPAAAASAAEGSAAARAH